MKAPKYIQLCIRRMLYHRKVVENNTAKVNEWFNANNIDKKISLIELLEEESREIVPKDQISIFDLLEENDERENK